jgi:excisionase family DNA binding protein
MKTFDLEECADYLKVNPTTVQGLAAQGKIPGAKIGRAWVFMEEDVADYLREQIRIQTRQRQLREGNDPESSTAPLPPNIERVKAVRGRKPKPFLDPAKYGF